MSPCLSQCVSWALTRTGGTSRRRPGHLRPLRPRFGHPTPKVRWGRDGDGFDLNRQKVDSSYRLGLILFRRPSFSGLLFDPVHHVLAELVVPLTTLSWCWEPTDPQNEPSVSDPRGKSHHLPPRWFKANLRAPISLANLPAI